MGTARFRLPQFKSAAYRLLRDLRQFSSSAVLIRRAWTVFPEELEPGEADGGSSVYKRALKYQRPISMPYDENLRNSISLIGTVMLPLKRCNTDPRYVGVHTILNVKASLGSYRNLTVMLKMWDETAEIAVQHLKPNDLIYVSGFLASYTKVDEYGRSINNYEVNVKEINFIAQDGQAPAFKQSKKLESGDPGVDYAQKKRERLHLWQIFFANPYEWRDKRKNKTNPNYPDFKHKDTGEALWVNDHDPPWIQKQLQLYDSRLRERSPDYSSNSIGLSKHLLHWNLDTELT